jgi:magnesium chelatase subunit D
VTASPRYPFSAVVGHEDVKLALSLAAVDPGIGGVLLRGQKGSAKTTLARGFAALLPGQAPFVELPLGATEERVVGSLDLRAVLAGEGVRFEPGLLSAADGGVLYVDEINLLADHLVDVLLDVAVSGRNVVERDGVSHEHAARFVLVGSMNPEEGELRPQLLDRFGLAVDVVSSQAPTTRAEVVRRRLAFDADAETFLAAWQKEQRATAATLEAARPAPLPDELLEPVAELCVAVGAEGLRADLVIARAAAALAGLEGRDRATRDDVRRVAPLVLAHRRRRDPFESPGIDEHEFQDAFDSAFGDQRGDSTRQHEAADPSRPIALRAAGRVTGAVGRRSPTTGGRGRLVGDEPMASASAPVAVTATARATAVARALDADAAPDLRAARRVGKTGNLVVLAVDTSGSMGVDRRISAVTAVVAGLLVDAYQRRDRVAVIGFRGDTAEVLVRPTGSVEVARARLATVVTGGRTPLAAGIDTALDVATQSAGGQEPLLVVVSDGRATAASEGEDPLEAALAAATRVRRLGVSAVVVDAEDGGTRLGLTVRLAEAMGARHLTLAELTAGALR